MERAKIHAGVRAPMFHKYGLLSARHSSRCGLLGYSPIKGAGHKQSPGGNVEVYKQSGNIFLA